MYMIIKDKNAFYPHFYEDFQKKKDVENMTYLKYTNK